MVCVKNFYTSYINQNSKVERKSFVCCILKYFSTTDNVIAVFNRQIFLNFWLGAVETIGLMTLCVFANTKIPDNDEIRTTRFKHFMFLILILTRQIGIGDLILTIQISCNSTSFPCLRTNLLNNCLLCFLCTSTLVLYFDLSIQPDAWHCLRKCMPELCLLVDNIVLYRS